MVPSAPLRWYAWNHEEPRNVRTEVSPLGGVVTARQWTPAASLRTTARRLENDERLLLEHMQHAYATGMSVREIGRHIGRSHRWVIDQLRAVGAYDSKEA